MNNFEDQMVTQSGDHSSWNSVSDFSSPTMDSEHNNELWRKKQSKLHFCNFQFLRHPTYEKEWTTNLRLEVHPKTILTKISNLPKNKIR